MERVVIVAKTYMQKGMCVSALVMRTNKGLRLRSARGDCQPMDTPFQVGQIWDLDFRASGRLVPPHVEDVHVTGERFIGLQPHLRETLIQRIDLWRGGLETIFDGSLVIDTASAYIGRERPLPERSTGFWLPDRPLTLVYRRGKPYYWIEYAEQGRWKRKIYVRYVGYEAPVIHIQPQTLVRISLSRWWVPEDVDEERCYLQLSGWYTNDTTYNMVEAHHSQFKNVREIIQSSNLL